MAAQTEIKDKIANSEVLLSVIALHGSIFLILLGLYCLLRNRYRMVFQPRNCVPRITCALAKQEFGAFSWIPGVVRDHGEDIFEQCGFTSRTFIRMLKVGRKISVMGCFVAIWLVPVYYSAPSTEVNGGGNIIQRSNFNVTDPLDKMSLGHTYRNDPRCTGAVIGSYIISVYAMYLIYHEFVWFVRHRHMYMKRSSPENYTVFFSDIPRQLRSQTALGNFFEKLFPNQVLEVHLVRHIEELESICSHHERLVAKVKHYSTISETSAANVLVADSFAGESGTFSAKDHLTHSVEKLEMVKTEMVECYTRQQQQWEEHERRVAEGEPFALENPPSSIRSASFVTFTSLQA
jgi:hypothetical protein